MTKYEKAIYELVEHSHNHPTAEEIFVRLRQRYPSVVLATVYNNLKKLWESGLIRKISVEGLPDRYDRSVRHDHLLCCKCGRLLDVNLADLTQQLQQQLDVPVLGYDLRLLYLCQDCQKQHETKRKER